MNEAVKVSSGERRTDPNAEIDITLDPVTVEEARRAEATRRTGKTLRAKMDASLDEIDKVLEDNAEEFVRSYVQNGGQ